MLLNMFGWALGLSAVNALTMPFWSAIQDAIGGANNSQVIQMAYVDLLQQNVTLTTSDATTYSFSDTLPPSQDGSPHITHLGIQLDGLFTKAADPSAVLNSNLSGLVTSYKVQVGSEIICDWYSPAATGALDVVPQFGALCQTLGGDDFMILDSTNAAAATSTFLGQFTLPVGLDASKAHRINVTLGFADVNTWSAGTGFNTGSTDLNIVVQYGTSTEATIIGGRQDNLISANAQRTVTIMGKKGWSMLGILACSDTYTVDNFSHYKINNGQFRQLSVEQWRAIAGRYRSSPYQYLTAGNDASSASGVASAVVYKPEQKGVVFLNLFRISAGADLQIQIQGSTAVAEANTSSIFPIWVAGIGQGPSGRPNQGAKQIDSPTKTVLNEQQSSNV